MPLFTDRIEQARESYGLLEARFSDSQVRARRIQESLDGLLSRYSASQEEINLLKQRVLDLEAQNFKLQEQVDQLGKLRADLTLQKLIESLGLSAALGEATMTDRALSTLAVSMQTYVNTEGGTMGLRFHQPEFGSGSGVLSTSSFELAKVPPQPGVPSPRSLYAGLQEKQRVYSQPFWSPFKPASQLVTELALTLAETPEWDVPYLARRAGNVASFERSLSTLVTGEVKPEVVADFEASVEALAQLAGTLQTKASPVAGDLDALAAALEDTTRAAKTILS
jgi:hypothetical protein